MRTAHAMTVSPSMLRGGGSPPGGLLPGGSPPRGVSSQGPPPRGDLSSRGVSLPPVSLPGGLLSRGVSLPGSFHARGLLAGGSPCWGVSLLGDLLVRGGLLAGGSPCQGGHPAMGRGRETPLGKRPPSPCGQTDTCKNITFSNYVSGL